MNVVPSIIERLPEAAVPAVQRAYDAIKGRRATQLDALAQLNEALQEIGVAPVSVSGFNRWAIRIREGEIRRPQLAKDAEPAISEEMQDLRQLAAELRSALNLVDRLLVKLGG